MSVSKLWSRVVILLLCVLLMSGCSPKKRPHPVDGKGPDSPNTMGEEKPNEKPHPDKGDTDLSGTRGEDTPSTKPHHDVSNDDPRYTMVQVPPMSQYPAFPTGCESVSAVMALRHAGISVSVDEFVDNYLECDPYFYRKNGRLYGPDPYKVFAGDPRSEYSCGCMAPVIENALLRCVGKKNVVKNTTGEALSDLCRRYIDQNVPILVWATMEMRPVGEGNTWILPDGRKFVWPAGEHCLLLVGYNDKEYVFNDPRYGTTVAYEKEAVEVAYAALGKQSLVIE